MKTAGRNRWVWGLIGLMIILGTGITIWDYREWRKSETEKYGQGWNDLDKPAEELSETYSFPAANLRMRLPLGWRVNGEDAGDSLTANFSLLGRINEIMEVWVASSEKNLTDLVDERVSQINENQTVTMSERAYIRKENLEFTVLEWREEQPGGKTMIRQEVWGVSGGKVIKIAAAVSSEKWPELKKTLYSIYENAEMLY